MSTKSYGLPLRTVVLTSLTLHTAGRGLLSPLGLLVTHPREDACQTLGSVGERVNAEGYVRRIPFSMAESAGWTLRRPCSVGHRPSQLSLVTIRVFSVCYLVLAFKLAPRHSPTQRLRITRPRQRRGRYHTVLIRTQLRCYSSTLRRMTRGRSKMR